MTPNSLPDLDFLRQCFRLDPDTGRLYWLERPAEHFVDTCRQRQWNTRHAGKEAGSPTSGGYLNVTLKQPTGSTRPKVHRVVFALANGRLPEGDVDHINGRTDDNRPSNLREATRSQNMANRRRNSGKSLPKGVYERGEVFTAGLTFRRKSVFLGTFATVDAAKRAYDTAALLFHGDFARPDAS